MPIERSLIYYTLEALTFLLPNMFALPKLINSRFKGLVTAIARFDDERKELLAAGAGAVYNISAEAGTGYVYHVCQSIGGISQMIPSFRLKNFKEYPRNVRRRLLRDIISLILITF
jgi:hypothetical protein